MAQYKVVILMLIGLLGGPFAIGDALAAGRNILFILDASGSMAGPFGNQSKIQAAKDVFGNLLADLPGGVDVGLEVYGHRGDKDCSVIEVMNPVGPVDTASIKANVQGLTPSGATPMAAALEKGAEALKAAQGEKAIVLISDGKETCGGDPTAVAKKLRAKGVNITTHVVGLGVNAEEKAQLSSIAEAGGGKYYAANNVDELKQSLAEIKKKVVAKKAKVIFQDDFDGEVLSDKWTVTNPDEDNMVIEDGRLTILLQPEWPNGGKTKNILLYSGDLPKNYEISAKFTADIENFPTIGSPSSQRVGLVMYKSKDNFIELTTVSEGFGGYQANEIKVAFGKYKKGKLLPSYSSKITKIPSNQWSYKGSFEFKILRNKYKYTGLFKNAKGKWVEIGSFTDLKRKFKPGILAYRAPKTAETPAEYDWFKIIGRN